jgi:hypothetical protein
MASPDWRKMFSTLYEQMAMARDLAAAQIDTSPDAVNEVIKHLVSDTMVLADVECDNEKLRGLVWTVRFWNTAWNGVCCCDSRNRQFPPSLAPQKNKTSSFREHEVEVDRLALEETLMAVSGRL